MTESLEEKISDNLGELARYIIDEYENNDGISQMALQTTIGKMTSDINDLFRQELKERLEKTRLGLMDNLGSEESDNDWFYGLGYNHAVNDQDKLIKEQLEDL